MIIQNIQIKVTNKNDINDIFQVEEEAFGHDKEAELSIGLLEDKTAEPVLSLLAFYKGEAIGHILFTRVYVNNKGFNQDMHHILAPLAIKPAYQKKGIGGLLIREGIEKLKKLGTELVFVLGHMEYYPRYGFIPDAKKLGYPAPYPIPEEFKNAWMVQAIGSKGFSVPKGKIICANELQKPEHWRE